MASVEARRPQAVSIRSEKTKGHVENLAVYDKGLFLLGETEAFRRLFDRGPTFEELVEVFSSRGLGDSSTVRQAISSLKPTGTLGSKLDRTKGGQWDNVFFVQPWARNYAMSIHEDTKGLPLR